MFLHALTPEQQRLFCMLARNLILADDVLHDNEAAIEEAILREVDLGDFPRDVAPLPDLIAGLRDIGEQPQRNALYVELVGIALVDEELHPAEAEVLGLVQRELGISDETARLYSDFAERFHTLASEGRLLVFESAGVAKETDATT